MSSPMNLAEDTLSLQVPPYLLPFSQDLSSLMFTSVLLRNISLANSLFANDEKTGSDS